MYFICIMVLDIVSNITPSDDIETNVSASCDVDTEDNTITYTLKYVEIVIAGIGIDILPQLNDKQQKGIRTILHDIEGDVLMEQAMEKKEPEFEY